MREDEKPLPCVPIANREANASKPSPIMTSPRKSSRQGTRAVQHNNALHPMVEVDINRLAPEGKNYRHRVLPLQPIKLDRGSDYVISIDPTPSNLTPSKRLQLRRDQISSSIHNCSGKLNKVASMNCGFTSRDIEIDAQRDFINVPFATSFQDLGHSMNHGGNPSNRFSAATVSTVASSVWSSHNSSKRESIASIDTTVSSDSDPSFNFATSHSKEKSLSYIARRLDQNVAACEYDRARQQWFLLNRSMEVLTCDSLEVNDESPHEEPSRTKQSHISYTRPTFLPPKCSDEKIKHQKEASKLVRAAAQQISRVQRQREHEIKDYEKQKSRDAQAWRQSLLTNSIEQLSTSPTTKFLFWRGIPTRARALVWSELLDKSTKITPNDTIWYFQQVDEILHADGQPEEHPYAVPYNVTQLDERISSDLRRIFEYRIQSHHFELIKKVIWSVILFINEKEQLIPMTRSTASSIRSQFYYLGMCETVYVLLLSSNDACSTFVKMCSLLNTTMMSDFVTYIGESNARRRQLVTERLESDFMSKFDSLLSEVSPNLKRHFVHIGLESIEYMPYLSLGFLTQVLNHDACARVIDAYLVDGHDALLRISISYFALFGHKCFGSKSEVLDFLGVESGSTKPETISNPTLSSQVADIIFSRAEKLPINSGRAT